MVAQRRGRVPNAICATTSIVLSLASVACGGGSKTPATAAPATPPSAPPADTAGASIDSSGGVITTPAGVSLEIPFGALDQATQISINSTTTAAPAGVAALGPVYQFEPSGTVLARPVKISLPVPAGESTAAIYWTALGTTSFESIGGTVS